MQNVYNLFNKLVDSKKQNFLRAPRETKLLVPVNLDVYRILRKEPDLLSQLLRHDFCIDGRPIFNLFKLMGFKQVELVHGSELIYDLAEFSASEKRKVAIFGGSSDSNLAAVDRLKNEFGLEAFGMSPFPVTHGDVKEFIARLESSRTEFTFLCLGAPRQEVLGIEMVAALKAPCWIICAGGSVDFLAGKVHRAPKWVRILCLEGLYRLWREPSKKRWLRLITTLSGLIMFLIDASRWRFRCGRP